MERPEAGLAFQDRAEAGGRSGWSKKPPKSLAAQRYPPPPPHAQVALPKCSWPGRPGGVWRVC